MKKSLKVSFLAHFWALPTLQLMGLLKLAYDQIKLNKKLVSQLKDCEEELSQCEEKLLQCGEILN